MSTSEQTPAQMQVSSASREVEIQRNDLPVTSYVEAWDWRCSDCGHVSRGHVSEKAARRDFDRHVCRPF